MHEQGAPPDVIDRMIRDANEIDVLHVSESEATAITLFMRSQTQWNRSDFSGMPTGLDYDGVFAVARGWQIDITPDVFGGLQVMEAEYIRCCSERRD